MGQGIDLREAPPKQSQGWRRGNTARSQGRPAAVEANAAPRRKLASTSVTLKGAGVGAVCSCTVASFVKVVADEPGATVVRPPLGRAGDAAVGVGTVVDVRAAVVRDASGRVVVVTLACRVETRGMFGALVAVSAARVVWFVLCVLCVLCVLFALFVLPVLFAAAVTGTPKAAASSASTTTASAIVV